jgi:predicted transcriptional regulator|tara:strand:- start:663 stop:869 length:207 start_codon:yes stop_codon:yes gene_type:complete
MKLKNRQIVMYMALGAALTLVGMYINGKMKKVEKYSREDLQSEIQSLVNDLEKDGLIDRAVDEEEMEE